ncbi:MAG: beta strand repeat-containing protein, partial [Gammaproteobacteria bacterium]
PNSSGGGSITVTGNINAAGSVDITASDTGYFGNSPGGNISLKGVVGKSIKVQTTAKIGANINAISFHATGPSTSSNSGDVTVSADASSGGLGGNITLTGGMIADHGNIDVTAKGGSLGGAITVSGAIQAGGSFSAHQSGSYHGMTLGNVTAGNAVYIYDSGTITGTNTLKVGNITAGSYVDVNVYQYVGNAKITLGNVTAGSGEAYVDGYAEAGTLNLTVGNVSGGNQVYIFGGGSSNKNATITTGTLTANNTGGPAEVRVTADGKTNTITTGAITAIGKLSSHAGSGETGFSASAATVNLGGSGSGNTAIKVNGGITITATGAHYHYSHASSFNTSDVSGSVGLARLDIGVSSYGGPATINITGAINVTGMGGAEVELDATKITLGGAVNITATPGKVKETGSFTSYGGPLAITYSGSAGKAGSANLFINDASGATLA